MKYVLTIKTLLLLIGTSSLTVYAGSSTTSSDTKPIVGSSSGSNINTSADKAKKQNSQSQMISQVVGVGMMAMGAKCASSCPSGCCPMAPMYFMMGAMSFQQASANGKTAGQAMATKLDSSALNPFGTPGVETNYLDPKSDLSPEVKGIVNSKSFTDLKKSLMSPNGLNGFKMNPKTGVLTGPDGKVYDPESLQDKAALEKAGFSPGTIDGAYAAAGKFETEAMKKLGIKKEDIEKIGAATAENGYNEGGAAKYASASSMDASSGYGGRGGYGSGGDRNPANSSKIAGLTKNFNGERIGVAAENIFNMMTRRFKVMEKKDAFFDPSELIPLNQ